MAAEFPAIVPDVQVRMSIEQYKKHRAEMAAYVGYAPDVPIIAACKQSSVPDQNLS
jgi:hypothetical protein